MKASFIACLFLTSFVVVGVATEKSHIITTYSVSHRANPPMEWRHLWNSKGEIGNKENYEFLSFHLHPRKWSWVNHYLNKSGTIKTGRYCVVPGCSEDDVRRYAISAYTFATDKNHNVWLTNGNLQCRSGSGILLKVYLNNTLKFSGTVKRARKPFLFQCHLGNVKKGDSVYVALASSDKRRASARLLYTFESFPIGEKPEYPVNIISPSPTSATPILGPDGRPKPKYIQKHQRQCKEILSSKPKLVFIGDSITARWTQKMFNTRLSKYKPAKLGVGGEWTQNTLWRVKNGVLGQVKPKAIVLLIGTNSVTHNFTAKEVTASIGTIIKTMRKQTPESYIIVMGIFPRGAVWSMKKNIRYKTIKKINANLAKIADKRENIIFIDIGDKLIESDGSISKEMMRDRLHIDTPGFEIWADALVPVLDKIYNNK